MPLFVFLNIIKENNYVNGYDILYVQAAYQFIYWFFNDFEIESILEDRISILYFLKKGKPCLTLLGFLL